MLEFNISGVLFSRLKCVAIISMLYFCSIVALTRVCPISILIKCLELLLRIVSFCFIMSECVVCSNPVPAGGRTVKIACSDCKRYCHGSCVNMNRADIECLISEKQIFRCPPCTEDRRKSMSALSAADEGKADISHVMFMLEKMEANFNKSFEYANAKIDDQSKLIKEQSEKFDALQNIFEELKQENVNLKAKITSLESRLEDAEQYSRSNTVEIFGVPEGKDEDTYGVVQNICVALDLTLTRENIDVCHRLGRPGSGKDGRPRGIIVKFLRREDKNKLLAKRKVKRNFSTQHLGFEQPAEPVYINENLSPGRRKLYVAAREAKKTKNYTYLWVQNGNILMRKDQGTSVVRIASMDDLHKL